MRYSYEIENKFCNTISGDMIAICPLENFTNFQWEKLYLSRSGFLLDTLKMDFIEKSGNHRIAFLPLRKYYASEDYVAHSPIGKELTRNSFFLLHKTDNFKKNSIQIQLLNENEYFFIREALRYMRSEKNIVKASLMTDFSWESVKIVYFEQQYFYKFDFFYDNRNLEIQFSLPSNSIFIDMGSMNNKSIMLDSDNHIELTERNGHIMMSFK